MESDPTHRTGFSYDVEDWSKKNEPWRYPEISDKRQGIAVQYKGRPKNMSKHYKFWASVDIMHGAGHNSGMEHSSDAEHSTDEGIMAGGNGLNDQWSSEEGSKAILKKEANGLYIQHMKSRFTSDVPKDNYGKR